MEHSRKTIKVGDRVSFVLMTKNDNVIVCGVVTKVGLLKAAVQLDHGEYNVSTGYENMKRDGDPPVTSGLRNDDRISYKTKKGVIQHGFVHNIGLSDEAKVLGDHGGDLIVKYSDMTHIKGQVPEPTEKLKVGDNVSYFTDSVKFW